MNEPSVTLHQHGEPIGLMAFADREGLTLKQVVSLAKKGQILGATKLRNGGWRIYPPAKLLSRPRTYEKRLKEPKRPAAPPDLLAGVDAVAVEARTESRQSGQASPQVEAEGKHPPADGVPEAFTKAQGACRTLALASSEGLYPVVLSGRQVLLLERALEAYSKSIEVDVSDDEFGDPEQPQVCSGAELISSTFSTLRNVGRNRTYQLCEAWPESMLGSQS